jgi:raffinose/stachyose/melibiose transport system permease protein
MKHNAILVGLSLFFQLPLSLGVALLLNRPLRGRSLIRLVFFAPYVLSEAITAIVFLQILQPNGLLDEFLRSIGLGSLVHLWLADLGLVFYTLFVVITWKYIGFGIILFLAGLQGIPRELHEAAAVDGATAWRRFWHITLPLLRPIIAIILILRTSFSFAVFEEILAITQGGPGDATWVAAWYSYKTSFAPPNNFGVGSASAYVLALLVGLLAIVYVRFVYSRVTL